MSAPVENFCDKVRCERNDCRISFGYAETTCLGWNPVYDRNGALLNQNPNKTSRVVSCSACQRRWRVSTNGRGDEHITEIDRLPSGEELMAPFKGLKYTVR